MDQRLRKALSNKVQEREGCCTYKASLCKTQARVQLLCLWVTKARFFQVFRKIYLVKNVSSYWLLITGLPATGKVVLDTVMVKRVFCPKYTLKLRTVAQNENSKPVPILSRISAAKEDFNENNRKSTGFYFHSYHHVITHNWSNVLSQVTSQTTWKEKLLQHLKRCQFCYPGPQIQARRLTSASL